MWILLCFAIDTDDLVEIIKCVGLAFEDMVIITSFNYVFYLLSIPSNVNPFNIESV